MRSHGNRSTVVCCQDSHLKSCYIIYDLDKTVFSNVTEDKEFSLLEKEFQFSNTIPPNGFVFKSQDGDEAIFGVNKEKGTLFGSIKMEDGSSFGIEHCGDYHIAKEFDMSSFKEDIAITDGVKSGFDMSSGDYFTDNTTIVTYSVMFYYTPEFASITTDIDGYIDQVLDETNQGYENSGIPVRVTRFCIEAATINDIEDTSDFLAAFRVMKGTVSALKNTADAAALLAKDFNSCGVAYLATATGSGSTVSIATKSCALGYYSFGHELGHNFGATHNPEVSTNSYFGYGHGHLIEAGTASTGYRTILAYTASGHSTRVNYYSNPSVIYPPTGTSTGIV